MDVALGALDNGTTNPARITFDVKQERLQAVAGNVAHKKTGA
jgi:hypothetical protein